MMVLVLLMVKKLEKFNSEVIHISNQQINRCQMSIHFQASAVTYATNKLLL
jgi:hypothetical protein